MTLDYSSTGKRISRKMAEAIYRKKKTSLRNDFSEQEALCLARGYTTTKGSRQQYRRIRNLRKRDIEEVGGKFDLNPKNAEDRRHIVKFIRQVRVYFHFLPVKYKDFVGEEYARRRTGRAREIIGHAKFYTFYEEELIDMGLSKGYIDSLKDYARGKSKR